MKKLLPLLLILFLSASQAVAGPIEDSISSQLRAQGFTQIEVSRTWLGRSRIVARSPELYREIIVNPQTGEILRDFWRNKNGGNGVSIFDPGGRGTGSAGEDDDDRDDDDDDGDDNGGDSEGGDSDGGGDDD